ncbi:hypothetical protein ECC02_002299 [Trypanosoma cruzi]|uniref:Uncharacterized protein n=1 Tax=Trypanosoma cruzi TaxID=5693 RepID=A0A7J6YDB0_TRYCR|nr:hypothetical protein ECC02_002299 [Trypanosoma cruzi]
MRRGQQAQPHSSHTTRRHPRKEGTQRQQPPTMQEEKTSTTISPSSSLQPQGNGKNPAATTQRTRSEHPPHQPHAQANPHPSMTRHQNSLPSRPQWDTEPNSTQSHAVHHTRRKRDSGCAPTLSFLLFMATEEDNSRHTQLPACTTKGAFKSTAMCILCVCLCVPAEIQSNKEVKKREQSVWRDAQQKCAAETHGGNNEKTAQTHDCTAAQAVAIHTRFI